MTSAFFGLNTALLGLRAQQTALEVTAHNVANANTDGYTRQEAVMSATDPYTVPSADRGMQVGQIGTGVQVDTIRRVRDDFLDSQLRTQNSVLGSYQTTQDYLGQVESVLNEPSDSGISSLLGKMWGAWQDLSMSPDSISVKATVVESATGLADALKQAATQLSTLRTQAGQEVDLRVGDVNGYLQQIAELNSQIQQVQVVGDQPNDLMDKRDVLLDQLSTDIPMSYQQDAQGQLQITVAGKTLVDGSSYGSLQYTTNGDGTLSVTVNDTSGTTTDVTNSVTTGELGGLVTLHDVTLNPDAATLANPPDSLAWRLDRLASTLITQVNQAYDPAGVSKFFDGTDASDIAVHGPLVSDPSGVIAGSSGQAGDGSIALAIANLQTQSVDCDGDGTPDSSLGDWYNQLVTKLGIDSQQAQQMTSNQQAVVNQLNTNKQSVSGVSLDEEATNMIRFQRAYEAAARVMTAMDEMLDKLINGTGTTG